MGMGMGMGMGRLACKDMQGIGLAGTVRNT